MCCPCENANVTSRSTESVTRKRHLSPWGAAFLMRKRHLCESPGHRSGLAPESKRVAILGGRRKITKRSVCCQQKTPLPYRYPSHGLSHADRPTASSGGVMQPGAGRRGCPILSSPGQREPGHRL